MIDTVSAISSFVDRSGAVSGTQFNSVQKAAAISAPLQQIDFGNVMIQVAANAAEKLKVGEASAIAGMQGKASVQQVVEAVMSAEQALQTAIAIRDKVVAAYQEISRMAI